MATYKANPINSNRGYYNKGTLIEPAIYGWHSQSPVMQASGSITFERKAKDDDKVYFEGTLATTVVSTGGFYKYPITAKMFVGNSLVDSYTIKENGVDAASGTKSVNIKGSFKLSNNTDDVTVHYYCNYNLNEGSCGSAHPSPDSVTFKLPAGTLEYLPYTKPTISISSDSTVITRYDGEAKIKWSGSSNSRSNTYLDINGTRVVEDSGDNAGEFSFKPSDYSVNQGSSYTVTVYRNGPYGNGTTVSASTTMYTYTNPTLSNLTKTIQIINANQTETFNWVTNTPKWKNKNLETHTEKMTIAGNNITEVSDSATSDLSTVTLANIGRYVPFDSTQINGQTVDVILTKTHTNDSNVPSTQLKTTITVRRIPTEYILKNTTSFVYKLKMKNPSDPRNNTSLAEDAIVDREVSSYINVAFTYPSNKNTEHYGIVNGYKIVVRSEDGSITFQDDIETNSLSTNYDIPVEKIKYSLKNTLEITPYYKHSNKTFNITVDNKKYYGPTQTRRFPSVITRLGKPVINFPIEGTTWINRNYRILFQLPPDGDFDNYGTLVATDYIYRDIEVEVKGGTTTKVYSWKNNPEIFSLNKLSYQLKVAINPSLMTGYPAVNEYKIRIRVRKNYGYPESYSTESWSDWSLTRTVKVEFISHSVNEGDYIMADHHNKVYRFIVRMKACYKDSQKPVKTKEVKKGDYILANPFDISYQDIVDVFDFVNSWETKSGDFVKNPVKFNNGNNLTSFNSTRGEYVTDLSYDTKPTGRNYMTILHEIANLCK